MPAQTASTRRATPLALVRHIAAHAHQLRAELGDTPHADSLAQSIACAAPILANSQLDSPTALDWLTRQIEPWEQVALERAHVLSTEYSVPSPPLPLPPSPSPSHLYDSFLHHYSQDNRKRRGVFFTPRPIAAYIVAQIDTLLREQCGFTAGLADERVTITDPACGTGVFLLAAIDFLHAKYGNSDYLKSLLPRLTGIEILPPAAFLAKLNITLKLCEIGYDFRPTDPINIITGDALSPAAHSALRTPHSSFPVLLGNPPFSSLSTNTNPWIARLVRGDDETRGYIRANGQELGERKTWLHDDYVKFIRLAQWHVEEAGCGIVGFVTNHGYLDNTTFRLMRHELLRVFPHIEILDLHGNRKKHETSPDATRDENIFSLDQGTAIGIFCRPPTPTRRTSEGLNHQTPSRLGYSELWGSRESKLASLADPSPALRASVLNPQSPSWQFVPTGAATFHPEYAAGWSLAEAMPVNTTAPVTARDHFVVAFTRDELIARLTEFRDLSLPDDVIRERYFQRTRSARYETGDTRGWKLSSARRTIATDTNWHDKIVRCLYRPFDWRFVFWHPAMIDWPRYEVTQHLVHIPTGQGDTETRRQRKWLSPCLPFSLSPPLCLIARRQQLPTQPCTFFWISDGLALDGVIRSDNRGSESLFPLYLAGTTDVPSPNFAPAFVNQFVTATQLTWLFLGRGNLDTTFGPEDLLAYIYALFHSPNYREKYAATLRSDFPRIVIPKSPRHFVCLALFGRQLIDLHLLRIPHSAFRIPHLPDSVANFRAGGYVAIKKWLQPKHRSPENGDYPRIVAAIARTVEIAGEIDAANV